MGAKPTPVAGLKKLRFPVSSILQSDCEFYREELKNLCYSLKLHSRRRHNADNIKCGLALSKTITSVNFKSIT